jgi:DNA-binding NarL/FixJ family response regulator
VLRTTVPETRVIVLTRHSDERHVRAAMRAGVHGYVLKSQSAGDLVTAIAAVREGKSYVSPGETQKASRVLAHASDTGGRLTKRERQVLQMIGEEKTTKQIAMELGISIKTAESHRTRLMQKIDIHTTAGLVRYGIRNGLIEP